ncbi:MAG: 50S ribosomal protein L29 [Candidatus Peregrinibacteria bacterium]|nr:50S ribosomal protein L29 [Candidatus Peregrinibacteria bacterium]
MRTPEELKKLDAKGLQDELNEARQELTRKRFDVKNNQAKDAHLIKKSKKYIAQILTALNNEA